MRVGYEEKQLEAFFNGWIYRAVNVQVRTKVKGTRSCLLTFLPRRLIETECCGMGRLITERQSAFSWTNNMFPNVHYGRRDCYQNGIACSVYLCLHLSLPGYSK